MDRELEAKEGADPKQSFMIGKRNNTQKKTSRSWNSSPKMGTKVKTVRLLQGHNSFLTPFFCKSQAAQRHSPKRPKHSEHLVLAAPAEKRVRKPNKNDEKRVLLQENGCEKVCSMCIYNIIYIWYIYIWYVLIYFTKKKGSKAVFLIDEFELLASLSTAGRKDAVCAARKTTIATLSMAYGNGNSPHQGHQGEKPWCVMEGHSHEMASRIQCRFFPWPCWLQWWHWNVQRNELQTNEPLDFWNSQLKFFTQGDEDQNRLRCQLPPRGFLLLQAKKTGRKGFFENGLPPTRHGWSDWKNVTNYFQSG